MQLIVSQLYLNKIVFLINYWKSENKIQISTKYKLNSLITIFKWHQITLSRCYRSSKMVSLGF